MQKPFTDFDSGVAGFSRSVAQEKTTSEVSVSTSEIVSTDKSVQVITTKNVEVQTTEQTASVSEFDENALLDFLRNFAPKVEHELRKTNKHFSSEFQETLFENEPAIATKKLFDLERHDKAQEVKVSHHISWNYYGNKIAVCLSRVKHEDWCKHTSYVLIYECDNTVWKKYANLFLAICRRNDEFKSKAVECIEVPSCIRDIKFHPFINSTLVCATEEGKVYVYNLLEKLENNSTNCVSYNNEKITQISWVTLHSQMYLAVSGSNDQLYLWLTSSYVENWKISKKFRFRTLEDPLSRAVVCFDFSSLNSQNFVVALEGGLLIRCLVTAASVSLIESELNPVVSYFESTSSVVSCIQFSLFQENVFATISIDQHIRIYQLHEKCPSRVLSLEYVPLGLEWNHLKEEILTTWSADGEIRYYNYKKCVLVKTVKPCDQVISIGFKVKGMRQLLAIADSKCDLSIWQTALIIS